MSEDPALYEPWAAPLRRWGLTKVALFLLDNVRPVALLFSQFLHMGAVGGSGEGQVKTLAFILEEDQACASFTEYLRKEIP